MPSASRSLGRKELRGVLRLCWSESGAPQTLPPSPELLVLLLGEVQVLKVLEVVMMEVVMGGDWKEVEREDWRWRKLGNWVVQKSQ